MSWDPLDPPSAAGSTMVVTGGNAGIGYFISEQLAAAGARVILASRSPERAATAMASIREHVPGADLASVRLDLASLSSVADAAAELTALGPIDVLINNAGKVAGAARRTTTEDGLELSVGANAIGHFALTARLWPAFTPTARVVGLGSFVTRMVRLEPDDLMSERRYRPFRAYSFSKHAVHGFAFELDRRLRAADSSRRSLLAHPGYSTDGLSERRPGINDVSALTRIGDAFLSVMAQGKQQGAWPAVRAALDPDAESGTFFGPSRGLAGSPMVVAPVASSAGPEFGAAFWTLAERATVLEFAV